MPAVRIAQARRSWESAVSVPVLESAGAIRAALEELGWAFERRKATKLFSKFALVIMMPKGAYVFQFIVQADPEVTIETWQTDVSAGSNMTFLKLDGFSTKDEPLLRHFLELYRRAVGKDPWRFTHGERGRAGYLLPEFSRAKKAWSALGFETKAKRKRPPAR
jgi:hypothetical protein